jgi:hypothetical protein
MGRVATLLFICVTAISANEPLTAYLRRVGPYRTGMTLPDMRRLLGDPRAKLEQLDGPQCSYVESNAIPEGLGFMFFYRHLVRIDVDKPGIPTASGIQVGDSEEKVIQVYRDKIKVEPHKYGDANDHYLIYTPNDKADRSYQIVFESWDGKVTRYRVGKSDAVALVEGCA